MLKYLTIIVLASLTACTHSVSKFYPEIVPKKSEAVLSVSPDAKNEMSIVYLGSGNLVLERNGEAIITDPFFSNQKLMKLLGKVKSNPSLYNTWKTNFEYFLSPSVVQAGLVSHTHYDHAMDLPLLLEDRYLTNMKVVYGNAYLPKIMQNFEKEGVRLASLTKEQVYDPRSSDRAYEWISVAPSIRVLPILSNHAPHTKKKLHMDKPLEEEYFDEHLIYSNSKTKAFKWSTGETYSFLIDFLGSDTLRVFLQTSASQPPFGFPPAEELSKRGVDLALVCYASTPNVDDYPNKLIELIQPDKLMFVHWEDFFRTPKSFYDQRLVRSTNPKKVRRRIDRLGKPNDYFMMPMPGTRIKVKY
ncbi:MAG: hypothetical protein WAU36_14925 [Cyclobacteriaceae bacterium]